MQPLQQAALYMALRVCICLLVRHAAFACCSQDSRSCSVRSRSGSNSSQRTGSREREHRKLQ
jgi:hypothetical protein